MIEKLEAEIRGLKRKNEELSKLGVGGVPAGVTSIFFKKNDIIIIKNRIVNFIF